MAKEVKLRHKIIHRLLYVTLSRFFKRKYRFNFKSLKDQRQYLVLSNHITLLDPIYLEILLDRPLYNVASDFLSSLGFLSKLLHYAFNIIPITKNKTEPSTLKKVLRIVKEGGTVCLFPEGNTTYTGQLSVINNSVVKFIRMLKLPVYFVNGYNMSKCQSRWMVNTKHPQKGQAGYMLRSVLEVEDYEKMSDDELYNLVISNLKTDDYANNDVIFKGKKPALGLERLIYACPHCGSLNTYSTAHQVLCKDCDLRIDYLNNGLIRYEDKDYSPKEIGQIVLDKYIEFLKDTINENDNEPFLIHSNKLFLASTKTRKKLGKACIYIFKDGINIKYNKNKELNFNYEDISITIQNKNKIIIWFNGETIFDKIYDRLLLDFSWDVSPLRILVTWQFFDFFKKGGLDLNDKRTSKLFHFGL